MLPCRLDGGGDRGASSAGRLVPAAAIVPLVFFSWPSDDPFRGLCDLASRLGGLCSPWTRPSVSWVAWVPPGPARGGERGCRSRR